MFCQFPRLRPLRTGILISILAFTLLFSGCREERELYGGTLVLSTLDEPAGFNPLFYLDTVSPNIGSPVFIQVLMVQSAVPHNGVLQKSAQVILSTTSSRL